MSFYLIIFSTLLSALFGFLRYKYSYWELNGVKQLKTHFLFGNLLTIRSYHLSELLQKVYDEFKGKAKVAGAYIWTQPIAVILDLDLVKTILIKDFNKFVDRVHYDNEENDPLSGHLFMLGGEKWRILRSKLTPTFTSGKMKFMFPTIVEVAKQLQLAIDLDLKNNNDGILEIYDIMGRYTTDVIGNCAFGVECNSLMDPNNKFREIGKKIFPREKKCISWRLFKTTYSDYLKFFGLRRFSTIMQNFMINLVSETVTMREKLNIKRNDFMNLLIELKNSKDENNIPKLTINQMSAQVFVFFAAGFETSSSNMTFGLYELAKQPNLQEKVRKEILEVLEKHNGELTYEAMMEMTYLEQVISETLRKYPALSGLTRYANEDYQVPDTDIIIEKGIRVYIPALAIHYDPEIYENPQEFRPERFSPLEIQKRHPQSFLGFGDGPRNCIGLRFGRMQARIGLITLLKTYKFSVCNKTPKNLKPSDYTFVLVPGEKVWLKVERM